MYLTSNITRPLVIVIAATTLAGYFNEAPEPTYRQTYHLLESPATVFDWTPLAMSTASVQVSGSSLGSVATISGGYPGGCQSYYH